MKTDLLCLEKFLAKLEGFIKKDHVSIVTIVRWFLESKRWNWDVRVTKSKNKGEWYII